MSAHICQYTLSKRCHSYPMELEEAVDFVTLATIAAHQQMAQLIHWSQFVEYMTSLRRPEKKGKLIQLVKNTQKINRRCLSGQGVVFLFFF